jgi:hypothetical protein
MAENTEVTFDSLVGEHLLDAVDTFNEQRERYGSFEDCECIRFRLDGKVYTAVEDPSDGYRSSMETLFVSDAEMRNVFQPVRVLARLKGGSEHDYQTDDTMELIDLVTGKVVLEVGTGNTDDYYPYFVASWQPENMATNALTKG